MKMTYYRILFVGCLCCLPVVSGHTKQGHAQETTSTEMGYHIYAILPENQQNPDNSFFDLRMTPGQEQTIEVAIVNVSSQEQTFTLEINQAYTNEQGFIDYSDKQRTQETNKELTIDQIATYKKTVMIQKQHTEKVPITLKMPKEAYSGELLAGIKVSKLENQMNQEGITNTYSYLLGLRLTENDQIVQRKIGLKKIEPTIAFGKASIAIDLINPVREAYGHLTYHVEVREAETGKLINQKDYTELQLAPVSTYHFSIDWDDEHLVAGNYKLKLIITDKKENSWTYHRKFSISPNSAEQVNTMVAENKQFPYIRLLLGAILLVLTVLSVFLIKKKWLVVNQNRKNL
ncbi:hypothetical protein ABID30_001932 [Enterococcus rotai]|uniref:Uncharacterized protein n=1 Tax=Enterococcus rotai TaxID=118060 RepID=A0A0U2MWE3_9ENTE|nr:DUF916 domain-containing protein [Enterococcus rotai]ALS36867.1 hypothetical protein ATZ35_06765 [Enterococcus rotai]